jgi:3-methyladenine DNA glycosylase AlkD
VCSSDLAMVKKAVSWALRQVGKRSPSLRRAALASARRIRVLGTPAARWIASDVIRELSEPGRVARIANRGRG